MPGTTTFRSLRDCLHCSHRSQYLFCNLSAEALADFDSLGVYSTVESAVRLFEEDTPITGVFVICSGRVKLSKAGNTLILKVAMPGDVLGLGAILSSTRYEVTAETIEPAELKTIPRKEFQAFMERHGEASMHAAQMLSAEYRAAFFDVKRLALSVSVAARLASVLLDWGRESACNKTEMRFSMTLTHEELASLIGSTRETVTRMLSRFKRDKLIEVRGATMLILNPEKLEHMAA
jgi:CRP/FNR family cyclic AMP-dependent transcriptional regulator